MFPSVFPSNNHILLVRLRCGDIGSIHWIAGILLELPVHLAVHNKEGEYPLVLSIVR
jgi:hypothetical protein